MRQYHWLLQQSVQNPTSENTNISWKSPSVENITTIICLGFIKPPVFFLLKKKTGSNSSIFSGRAHYLGCLNTDKHQWNWIDLNFNQIKTNYLL